MLLLLLLLSQTRQPSSQLRQQLESVDAMMKRTMTVRSSQPRRLRRRRSPNKNQLMKSTFPRTMSSQPSTLRMLLSNQQKNLQMAQHRRNARRRPKPRSRKKQMRMKQRLSSWSRSPRLVARKLSLQLMPILLLKFPKSPTARKPRPVLLVMIMLEKSPNQSARAVKQPLRQYATAQH